MLTNIFIRCPPSPCDHHTVPNTSAPLRECARRPRREQRPGELSKIRRSGFDGRARSCHAVCTCQYRAVNGHLHVRFEKANLHTYVYRPTALNCESCLIEASSTKVLRRSREARRIRLDYQASANNGARYVSCLPKHSCRRFHSDGFRCNATIEFGT